MTPWETRGRKDMVFLAETADEHNTLKEGSLSNSLTFMSTDRSQSHLCTFVPCKWMSS